MTRVAVVGSGVMAAGIAASLLSSTEQVSLWGRRDEGVAGARARARDALATLIGAGLVERSQAEAAFERSTWTTDLTEAVSTATFVVEAVTEELELKRALLREVEQLVPPETVLTSTTSALSPTLLADGLERPDRFAVAHYAQPAHLMMLVEVVPGTKTSAATLDEIDQVLAASGKMPARCADIPGFVFSRLQQALLREFVHLVERGDVTPETCDTVLKYGFAHRLPAMGTFEHADLAGLDLMGEIARHVWPDLACASDPDSTLLGRMRGEGRTGMAAGQGFYDWKTRDAAAFRAGRDEEIVRRLRLLRGGEVVLDEEVAE